MKPEAPERLLLSVRDLAGSLGGPTSCLVLPAGQALHSQR